MSAITTTAARLFVGERIHTTWTCCTLEKTPAITKIERMKVLPPHETWDDFELLFVTFANGYTECYEPADVVTVCEC